MTLEDNKAIVRRFLEEGNREGMTPVELCAKGFTAHISGSPAMDLQSFQQYQVTYFASFSQSGIIIEDMIAEGDKVAFRGVVRAIHMREFMGTPSSGKQVVVSVIGFARLKEGKIEEWWNSPDRLSWMQQIGALPSTKLA
ncbi:ester cyclase [Candidatus Bathyarchaeota archaeon]|nr:ester cyclase [Candidatus Bathyarchaeota archaeon]